MRTDLGLKEIRGTDEWMKSKRRRKKDGEGNIKSMKSENIKSPRLFHAL